MKVILWVLAAGAIAVAVVTSVSADETRTIVKHQGDTTTEISFAPAAWSSDLNRSMLRDFERAKEQDPAAAQAIARNPRVVENVAFVDRHSSLRNFLNRYPEAREQIVENPGNFVVPRTSSTHNKK